ncbi:hypothetical protein BKD30_01050 [Tersicoccus phoenicis]|uniref:Uncharacterized protein n=1 Tax=Tersicoccus phoenicis TaxID=554083 RepID=A0A1R1LP25_9MICC|nr:hypothetical protein [Tersicoccus phoenicis]OMH29308.1 hypothetical protein BKD30_01050 [Tersicoccus phoenicis]
MSDQPVATFPDSSHGTNREASEPETSTYLCPEDRFPELGGLSLVTVQALHSRVCRQIDREYLYELDGPSLDTLDCQQELCEELDRRERSRSAGTTR